MSPPPGTGGATPAARPTATRSRSCSPPTGPPGRPAATYPDLRRAAWRSRSRNRDGRRLDTRPSPAVTPGHTTYRRRTPPPPTDEEGTPPRVKRELIPAVHRVLVPRGGIRHQRVAGRGDVPAVPRRPVQRGPGLARVLRRLPARQPGRRKRPPGARRVERCNGPPGSRLLPCAGRRA